MWEMVTRKSPWADRNFMGVSLDVLEGRRPPIPGNCPEDYRSLMEKCWHAKPERRPKMEEIINSFNAMLGEKDEVAGFAHEDEYPKEQQV